MHGRCRSGPTRYGRRALLRSSRPPLRPMRTTRCLCAETAVLGGTVGPGPRASDLSARAMDHSRHRRTRRPTRPPAPSRRHNRSMTALGNFRGQPFKMAGPLGEHQAVPSAISGVEDALDDVLKPVVVVGEVAVDRCHAPGRLWCRVACIGVAGGVHQQDRVREMGIDGGVIVGPDQTVRTTHRSRRRRCESSAARSWLPDRRRRVRSASSRR